MKKSHYFKKKLQFESYEYESSIVNQLEIIYITFKVIVLSSHRLMYGWIMIYLWLNYTLRLKYNFFSPNFLNL